MINLKVKIRKLTLENPLMNASGVLGLTGLSLRRVADSGVGAVITKSVGVKHREGYPNPTVVEVEYGLLNSMGLPNPGIDEAVGELKIAAREVHKPIIVSVYGFTPREFKKVAKKIDKLNVSGLELNVSCPHVREVGIEIGQREDVLAEVIRKVKAATCKPVLVKLSPNVSNIAQFAKTAEEAGADALTAINTVRAMAIDIETCRPILGGKIGGLSGPAIKPLAVRCIYEIYESVRIPIIGCGGITGWHDAVEFLMAGASALQVGTAVKHSDLAIFKEILDGLKSYMKKRKIKAVKDLVGLAHRR